MDYAEAVAAFFTPRPDVAVPSVVAAASPARRLRDAVEPFALQDVWSRAVNEAMAARGLDFLSSYVGGRAAVLGEPRPEVVAAVFAWFEPGLVQGLYDAARSALPLPELVAVRDAAVAASLREVLGDRTEVQAVADRLSEAAVLPEATGRALYAGLRAKGRPVDPWQRLWWACDLVREHRGDSHIQAAGAAGLSAVEMNVLTELWLGMPLLSYTGTRAWPAEATDAALDRLRGEGLLAGDALTDSGRALRELVEDTTDLQEQTVVQALGADLDPLCRQLSTWSRRCVDAAAFPPDPLKRAAG